MPRPPARITAFISKARNPRLDVPADGAYPTPFIPLIDSGGFRAVRAAGAETVRPYHRVARSCPEFITAVARRFMRHTVP